MKIIISESQYRLITESEEELEKIYEISKSDLDLAEMLISNYDISLEELYGNKFNHMVGEVFSSCDIECGFYDFNFIINFIDYNFDEKKPIINVEVIIDPRGTVDIEGEVEYKIKDAINHNDFGWEVTMEVEEIINEILTPHFDGIEISVMF